MLKCKEKFIIRILKSLIAFTNKVHNKKEVQYPYKQINSRCHQIVSKIHIKCNIIPVINKLFY